MNFSYIDYAYNMSPSPPIPVKNAGLYTGKEDFSGKPWGNDYLTPYIEPNAENYLQQFYAKNQIPSANRPGNNTLNTDLFKYYDETKFNFKCSQ